MRNRIKKNNNDHNYNYINNIQSISLKKNKYIKNDENK